MNKKIFAILILSVFLISLGSCALTTDIVSYYKMDGNALDSVGTNHGTVNGATVTTGKINQGYSFTGGTSSIIRLPTLQSDLYGKTDVTFSLWIETKDFNSTATVYSDTYTSSGLINTAIRITDSNNIEINTYGINLVGWKTSSYALPTSGWHHISLVMTQADTKLYVDSDLKETYAGTSGTGWKTGDYGSYIGGRVRDGNHYAEDYNGKIDEVGIWNRALTSAEVTELYASGAGNQYPFVEDLQGINVELISPLNNTLFSDIGANFSSKFTPSGLNLTNATYTLWKHNNSDWSIFNETTITLSGNDTTNYTQFIDSFTLGAYKWNVYSCGTNSTGYSNCSWGNENRTFEVGATILSEEYLNSTYESELKHFEINISLLENTILYDVKFKYNDTEYAATITDLGNETYKLSYNLYIPNIIGNVTFCWEIYYDDLGVIKQQELGCHDVEVFLLPNIQLTSGACDAGLFEAANFTFKDEGNDSLLNLNMQYNFKYGIDNYSSKMLYGEFSGVSEFRICVNESLGDYKVGYGEIAYEASNHVNRRFYLYQGQILNNETTKVYNLYDLLNSDAVSFIFEVKNTFLNVFSEKYLGLLRWYPEYNEYKVVEMAETDSDGRTVMKVETEDVDYRIGLYEKNGSLIKLADSVRMACLSSPCTYSMKVIKYDTDYFSSYDVDHSLTFDKTNNRFLFVWNDEEQKTNRMRLEVYKVAGNQDILICNSTSDSFTGVLSCNIGDYTGLFSAKAYRKTVPETLFDSLRYTTRQGVESSFGLFLSALMTLACGLVGLYNPIAAIVLLIVALVPSLALGAINLSIFMGVVTLGGIIIHFIKKSR